MFITVYNHQTYSQAKWPAGQARLQNWLSQVGLAKNVWLGQIDPKRYSEF